MDVADVKERALLWGHLLVTLPAVAVLGAVLFFRKYLRARLALLRHDRLGACIPVVHGGDGSLAHGVTKKGISRK